MRVIYFHQHFSTPKGSIGIRSYKMAQRLIERGHHVIMVCGRYSGGHTGLESPFINGERRGTVNGIYIIEIDLEYSNSDSFKKRSLTFLAYAKRSIKLIFTEKYDLIFATSTPLTAGVPGIIGKWLLRKPFVFEVRDLWPELPKAMGVITNPIVLGLMSVLEFISYRSADHCIGLSPGIVAGIKARGILSTNISLIPNGCDLDLFSLERESWRPKNVQASDMMVLFSGTHGVANGLSAVLDVAAVLKDRKRSDIKFVLIGEGKLKLDLMKRAKQESLDNIIFLDSVNKEKLAGLMNNTDLGMQILENVPAFYYGTSPNKFFDYAASGLPILTNYPGWIADMILENNCGFVVKPHKPHLFANVLEQAAKDRNSLVTMGRNSRKLAIENFDREKLSNNFVATLEKVISE